MGKIGISEIERLEALAAEATAEAQRERGRAEALARELDAERERRETAEGDYSIAVDQRQTAERALDDARETIRHAREFGERDRKQIETLRATLATVKAERDAEGARAHLDRRDAEEHAARADAKEREVDALRETVARQAETIRALAAEVLARGPS
jgi:hypothetical protein